MQILPWKEDLPTEINHWTDTQRNSTLFLEQHPNYPSYLLVSSFDPEFALRLKSVIGEQESIHMLKLDDLYRVAEEQGYRSVAFLDDPSGIYEWVENLDEPYPLDLNVELKRFQTHGFNMTKDLPSTIINWSTGTGKSVYSVARAKYLLHHDLVDKVVVCSKNHNKINWQRTFAMIADLEAVVAEASGDTSTKRERRSAIYQDEPIIIINYEKLRFRGKTVATGKTMDGKKMPAPSGDGEELLKALTGKRIFWIWDEMPTKMKSMSTGHYKGAQKIMRKTKKNYQAMLSATPIELNPEDVYSCMKILDNTIWPNLQTFRNSYAKSFSAFSPWQVAKWDSFKLQEMSMRIAHITHQANKYRDPVIAAEFPEEHWEDVYIDMSPSDRKLYNAALNDVLEDLSGDYNTLLTKMSVLQMICNNPAMVPNSQGMLAKALAAKHNFGDHHCAKLDYLKDMLDQIDGKIVLFSMYNDFGARMLMRYIANWGHQFVLYDGTAKQKQAAHDRFQEDERIKIFLSSDQGSDSINLEKATTVINYDLPWNHSTLVQRVNRINRITSEADHVWYYNLIIADTIEERKLKILNLKKSYHDIIFDGEIGEQSEILATTSLDDLLWILRGDH